MGSGLFEGRRPDSVRAMRPGLYSSSCRVTSQHVAVPLSGSDRPSGLGNCNVSKASVTVDAAAPSAHASLLQGCRLLLVGWVGRGGTPERQQAWVSAPPLSLKAAPSPAPCTWQSRDRAAAATQRTGPCGEPAGHPDPEPGVIWPVTANVVSSSQITETEPRRLWW